MSKVDRRQFNKPPSARTPKKNDEDKSRPYQFRLNPTDSQVEKELRDFIVANQANGWTLRGIVLEFWRVYTDRKQPAQIEYDDYHEMKNAVQWIVEQIESGALAQPAKGGKKETSVKKMVVPPNLETLFTRLNSKGATAQSLQIDEDE